MKRAKRLLAILLCGSLVFSTACAKDGKTADTTGTTGMWVESGVELAEDIDPYYIFWQDDTLVCFDETLAQRWESRDNGESWEQADSAYAGTYTGVSLMEDGRVLGIDFSTYSAVTGTKAVEKTLPDMDRAFEDAGNVWFSVATYAGNGRLAAMFSWPEGESYASQSGIYDIETGAKTVALDASYVQEGIYDGSLVYMLDWDYGYKAYNPETGGLVTEKSGKFLNFSTEESVLLAANGDALYLLTQTALQSAVPGEDATVLMHGIAYAFGDPALQRTGFAADDAGVLYACLRGEDGGQLYRYEWDEGYTPDPTLNLRVWALVDNPSLRATAAAFRLENPGATVTIETPLQDSGMTANDAISVLNTEILAGKGPDIIVLDGTPLSRYEALGILEDLTDLVDTSGMLATVSDYFAKDNGTYMMPVKLGATLFLHDEGTANPASLEQLGDNVQKGNQMTLAEWQPIRMGSHSVSFSEYDTPTYLWFESMEVLFDLLWYTSAPAIVYDSYVDTDTLAALFTEMKKTSDCYGLGEWEAYYSGHTMGGSLYEDGPDVWLQDPALAYAVKRSEAGAIQATSILELLYLLENAFTPRRNAVIKPFPGLADSSWQPMCLLGISSASDKKELATGFIQTALSDRVQAQLKGYGMPVTLSGARQQIDSIVSIYMEAAQYMDVPSDFGEAWRRFDYGELITQLGEPNLVDPMLRDDIYAAAEAYCKGELDLEGAMAQVEGMLNTYIAERQD